uniref:Uncharacterized protein n=1 Tax=Pristionchus pacificus TaxID=54126 RepID=A0A2A6CH18_PRIPA|eukprot:PDM77380.1 hypothetical protein PRIPAC_33110 [Pristionchus pacificus]
MSSTLRLWLYGVDATPREEKKKICVLGGTEWGLYRNCAKYPSIASQYTLVTVGRCVGGKSS